MKSYIILTLLALFGVISCNSMKDELLAPFLDGPIKLLFRAYHEIYRKDYDLNTEEGLKRYRIFKDNYNYIRQENAKNHSYKLGINEFADMNMKEIEEKMNLSPLEGIIEKMKMSDQTSSAVSSTKYSLGYNKIDWTEYLGPVKNQGGCGCCYAVASIAGIEANYKIFSGKSILLSPQQIVDCNKGTNGCYGGNPFSAIDYLIDNGCTTELDYPYIAKQNTCKYQNGSGINLVKNYDFAISNIDDFVSLLKKGPLIYSINASFKDFYLYKSGVMDYPNEALICNHVMVAVALLNGDGYDYIRFQNTWGGKWGDNGFVNIKVRNNQPFPFPTNGLLPLFYYDGGSFYTECNFKGNRESNQRYLPFLKDVKNNIKSIRTGNSDVYVFDQETAMGNYWRFTNDVECSDDLYDEAAKLILQNAKSILIINSDRKAKAGCVILYFGQLFDINSEYIEVCEDNKILGSVSHKTSISSIQFGERVKSVKLYNKKDFIGQSNTYTQSIPILQTIAGYSLFSLKLFK